MTDFNQNVIKTAGTFRVDKKDSPMDVRCRISTLSEIYRIPLPYLGMLVYNLADQKTYQVTALGPDPNAPVPEPDAVVAAFEVLEGGNGTQVAGKPFVDLGTTPASMTIHHDGNATPYAIYTLSDGGSGSTEGIILHLANVVNNAYGEILLKQTGRYSVYLGNWIMSDGTTTPLQGQLRMEMSPGSATLVKWNRADQHVYCTYETVIPEAQVPVVHPIRGMQCLYADSNLCHLTWISPETNNGQEGADQYDLRYSATKLSKTELELKWNKLDKLQTPTPSLPGSQEYLTVNRLTANTSYYFYLKALKMQSGKTHYSDLYTTPGTDYAEENGSYVKVHTQPTLAFDETHSHRKLQQVPLIEDQIFLLRPSSENLLHPVQNALDNVAAMKLDETGKPRAVVNDFTGYWGFPLYQKEAHPNYITIDLLNPYVFESMWFCIDKKIPVDGYKASGGEEGNGNAPADSVGITFYYKIAEATHEWVEFDKMRAHEVQTNHQTWVHISFSAEKMQEIQSTGARFLRIGFDDYVYGVFNTTKLAHPAGCDDTRYTDLTVTGDTSSGLSGSTYAWEGSNPLQMEHIYAFALYGYRVDDSRPDNILPPRRRSVQKYPVRDSFNNHGQAYYEGKLISTVSGHFTRFYMNLGDLTYLRGSRHKQAAPFGLIEPSEGRDLKSQTLGWEEREKIVNGSLDERRKALQNIKINLDTYNWITDQGSWKYFGKDASGRGIYGKARTIADSFQWNLLRYGIKPYLAPVGLPYHLRHYHHTWQNSTSIGFPLDQYWSYADTQHQYKNGFPLPTQGWRGWQDLHRYAHDPRNYAILAKIAFSLVAKLGSRDWSEQKEVLDYIFPTPEQLESICPGYTLHDTATGCDVISGIEYFNEPDGYAGGIWMNRHDPTTMAAAESAWNDGNQHTLTERFGLDFPGFGTKNADPHIPSIGSGCAGLAPGHLFEYFTFWLNHRTSNEDKPSLVQGICPLDILKTHSYFSSDGSQFQEYAAHATGVSVSRAKRNGTHKTIFDLEKLRDRYFPGTALWMSEFGWGEAGQCGVGADPSNNLVSQFQLTTRMPRLYYHDSASRKTRTIHRSQLKGCFAISGYIELLASGFQGCNYYMLESEDNSDSAGGMSDFFDAAYNPQQGWITGGPGYEMFHFNDIPDEVDRAHFDGTYSGLDKDHHIFQYLKENYQSKGIRPAFSATGLCGSPLKMGFYPLTNAYWYILTFRTHLNDYTFCGMKDISVTVNGHTQVDEKIKCGCFKKIDPDGTEHGAYVLWYADCHAEELTANLHNYTYVDPYGGYVNNASEGLPADLNSALSYEVVEIPMPDHVDRIRRVSYQHETLVPNPRQAPWSQVAYQYGAVYTPDPRYPEETVQVPVSRGSWNVQATWEATRNSVSYDQINLSRKNRCNAVFTYSPGTKQSGDETVYGMAGRNRLILPTCRRERAVLHADGTIGRWENVNQRWGDRYDEIESFTLRPVSDADYFYEEFEIKDFATGQVTRYRERIVLPTFHENPYFPMVGPVHAYYGDGPEKWPEAEGPRANRYYPEYGSPSQFVTDNAYAWRQSDALADYANYSADAKAGKEGVIRSIVRGESDLSDYYLKSQFTPERILKTDITLEPILYLFDATPEPSFHSRVENLTAVKNNSSSLTLWWNNNNPDDASYRLYMNEDGTTGAFTKCFITLPAGGENSYRINGLTPSTSTRKSTYAFAICPVNEAGQEGLLSEPLLVEMSESFAAPEFTILETGYNKVILNWQMEEPDKSRFSYFQIQRFSSKDTQGVINVANLTDPQARQFTDTKGLLPQTTYTYQIRAHFGTERTEWMETEVSTVAEKDSKACLGEGVYDGEKIILLSDIDLTAATFSSLSAFSVKEAGITIPVTSVQTGGRYLFLYCSCSKYTAYKSIRVSYTGDTGITTVYGKGLFEFSHLRIQNNHGRGSAHSYHVAFQYFRPEDIRLEWKSPTDPGTPEHSSPATGGVTWQSLSDALQKWCVIHSHSVQASTPLKEVTGSDEDAPQLTLTKYTVSLATGSVQIAGKNYTSQWNDADKYDDGKYYKYQEPVNVEYNNLYRLGDSADSGAPEDLYDEGVLKESKRNGFLYASRHACHGKWQGSEADAVVIVSGLKADTKYRMKAFAAGNNESSYPYVFAGEKELGSGTVNLDKAVSQDHGKGQWIACDWGIPDSQGNLYLVFPKVAGNGFSRFLAFLTVEEEMEIPSAEIDSLELRDLSLAEAIDHANAQGDDYIPS